MQSALDNAGLYTTQYLTERVKQNNLLRSAFLFPGTQGVLASGGARACLSSSSLSDPPEELLSEPTTGGFFPAPDDAPSSARTRDRIIWINCGITDQISWGRLQDTHQSSCGFVWLLYLHRCRLSPQESCTWDQSPYCEGRQDTITNTSQVVTFIRENSDL